MIKFNLNEEQLQDCLNLHLGLFYPLEGFMNSKDYTSVIKKMQLSNNDIWTIPITLDVDSGTFKKCCKSSKLELFYKNKIVGILKISDHYTVDIKNGIKKVFKTIDPNHPGVRKELSKHKFRVGGKVVVTAKSLLKNSLNPLNTKKYFKKKKWKTIAGFQTRNPIHKGHEYLQRIALDICDALFINPLIGWKKKGDFSEIAVQVGYKAMLKYYYNGLNIHFDTLKTPMRYAGPREAIFHAIIRRNLGCTHFIIGRDHAGVGNYYGKYEAQELARSLTKNRNLGIKLLLFKEPYYCNKCKQIVSEKTCNHLDKYVNKISGTKIRSLLKNNQRPSELYMRKEVADSIIKLNDDKFIKSD
jgi:sulfate adenylyltransferase